MNLLKSLALAAVIACCLTVAAPKMQAQVSVGISIGAAPVCPYGYYNAPPYTCAPDGYYGPDWFTGGIFIGAGPWFHGPSNFHGHVNNRLSPEHGYHGPTPQRGEARHPGKPAKFKSNEVRDGRGHVVGKGGVKH